MAVTFLTTEDAQGINTQLSNLVLAIAELNKKIGFMEIYNQKLKELQYSKELWEKRIKYYESEKYKSKIIKQHQKKQV